jgi:hypothetical protein
MHLLAVLSMIIGIGSAPLSAGPGAGAGVAADTNYVAPPADSARPVVLSSVIPAWPDSGVASFDLAPADTPRVRPRPKPVELSDWYSRRLTIHRYVAYATMPVFAFQWIAGNQLYQESRNAPTWAKTGHRAGATALAAMFTVNTVTGAWNWWDSRTVSQGRWLRNFHALSMLTADAGFTWAGASLSEEAETSASKRRLHRTIALECTGLTVISAAAMKIWNR